MSTRLLVSDLQDDDKFRIPTTLNICPDDPRFYVYLNLAEDMMLNQGAFYGSVVEAQFCVRNGCLTFPRQVAAVKQIAVNGQPLDIENGFYSFTRLLANLRPCAGCDSAQNALPSGTSGRRGQCGHWQMRMKEGTVASFETTRVNGSVIRIYPDPSDVGKQVIVQGNNSSGIWVRTIIDGTAQDGERVVLALPYVDTVTTWGLGAPVAVAKDTTNYRVLLYEVAGGSERLLANYEPSETRPTYKQGWIPGLRSGGCSSATAQTTVQAMVKLQHVHLSNPSDWLVLQNPNAYKAAMVAVKAKEERDFGTFNLEFYGTQASGRNARGVARVVNRGGAIPLLVAELRTQTDDRTNVYVYHDESNKFVGTMMNFI